MYIVGWSKIHSPWIEKGSRMTSKPNLNKFLNIITKTKVSSLNAPGLTRGRVVTVVKSASVQRVQFHVPQKRYKSKYGKSKKEENIKRV
jgi:hypothetical protein